MLTSILTVDFWIISIVPISLLALPVLLVGKASPFRSFMTATVIYLGITLLSACNVPGPF